MSSVYSLSFEPEFLETILKSQAESERLGCKKVSDILVFKNLIFSPDSVIGEIFQFMDVKWNKVKPAIESEIDLWKKEEIKEINLEQEDNVHVEKCEEDIVTIVFNKDLAEILVKSLAFSLKGHIIDEVAFLLAMLDNPSDHIISFFKSINIDYLVILRYCEGVLLESTYDEYHNNECADQDVNNNMEEHICEESFCLEKDENGEIIIPEELEGFLKIVRAYESSVSPILGRDEETEKLTRVLLKAKKSNAILVGKPGVGKTAIVEDLAWRIANGKCAKELLGKTIISLDVNDIIAGTAYRGMAEARFKMISEFLANSEDVILFIDEIHNVIGAGNSGLNQQLDFANALKPILAREGIAVIGATTDEEYERIIRRDSAFKRRFEKIIVREPKAEEVFPMIKEQVNMLSKYHGVSITRNVTMFLIKVSGCFMLETSNPDRTLDLVDRSMASAKHIGRKSVTSEIALSNFDANFKMFSKMSDKYKSSIAYHEAGHYIVAKYGNKYSKNALAVSIIPAEDYLGVTVYDDEPTMIEWDYNAHIGKIAAILGGRVAEEMFTGQVNSGASSDLEIATEEARDMLMKYGLLNRFSRRNAEKDFNEERIRKLNDEIDNIINDAYALAEKILKEHQKVLKEIARMLVKRGILIDEDLVKICERAEHKSTKLTKPEKVTTH